VKNTAVKNTLLSSLHKKHYLKNAVQMPICKIITYFLQWRKILFNEATRTKTTDLAYSAGTGLFT